MAGKAKVADIYDAFGLAYTMSVGDVLGKNSKKNSRKSINPPKETDAKMARLASVKEAASAHPTLTPMVSPDGLGSQLQAKSRFYAKYSLLSNCLVHGQLFSHGEV